MPLKANKGNYKGIACLTQHSRAEIISWLSKADVLYNDITTSAVGFVLTTDASRAGWGAVTKDNKTGGSWTPVESELNINALELKAVQFGLKSLCKSKPNVHIHLRTYNVTAVTYINNMGGTKSRICNLIANEIRTWSINWNIWLSAEHLPGSKNVVADEQSPVFDDTTEWIINKCVFLELVKIFGSLAIDLFASQLAKQVTTFVSWKPDPGVLFIGAFSRPWHELNLYAFPPFSVVGRCINKKKQEKAQGMIILPLWHGFQLHSI